MLASTLATFGEVSTVPVTTCPPVTTGELIETAMICGGALGEESTTGALDAVAAGDLLGAGNGLTGAADGAGEVAVAAGSCAVWPYHSSAATAASTIRAAARAANLDIGVILNLNSPTLVVHRAVPFLHEGPTLDARRTSWRWLAAQRRLL